MQFQNSFVFGYACFMCICFKTAIWIFLVKTGWQPCTEDVSFALARSLLCDAVVLNLFWPKAHQKSDGRFCADTSWTTCQKHKNL